MTDTVRVQAHWWQDEGRWDFSFSRDGKLVRCTQCYLGVRSGQVYRTKGHLTVAKKFL